MQLHFFSDALRSHHSMSHFIPPTLGHCLTNVFHYSASKTRLMQLTSPDDVVNPFLSFPSVSHVSRASLSSPLKWIEVCCINNRQTLSLPASGAACHAAFPH